MAIAQMSTSNEGTTEFPAYFAVLKQKRKMCGRRPQAKIIADKSKRPSPFQEIRDLNESGTWKCGWGSYLFILGAQRAPNKFSQAAAVRSLIIYAKNCCFTFVLILAKNHSCRARRESCRMWRTSHNAENKMHIVTFF